MVSSIQYVFGAIIISSFASTAFGIHCNMCNFFYFNNSTCDDPFVKNERYKHNCHLLTTPKLVRDNHMGVHLEATGCIKKIFEQDGETKVHRSCYWGDLLDTKSACDNNPDLPHLHLVSCDVCDSEMCNSSNAIASSVFIIALFYGLARLLMS